MCFSPRVKRATSQRSATRTTSAVGSQVEKHGCVTSSNHVASPQFKVSPKAGACALGPRTHGCRVIAGGGACGEQETQKTHAPGPVLVRVLPVLTAAAACTFLYGWPRGPGVSVLAAWLNVRREMSGARSDSPGGRSPAWTLGSRDGAFRAGGQERALRLGARLSLQHAWGRK